MFNFFCDKESRQENCYYITGNDFNHIKNVLRMNVGDRFLVSNGQSSDLCKISHFLSDTVIAEIIEKNYQSTSLPIEIYLFQGLPKSDKLELIIQKAVELGVTEIIPTEMEHCVVKLDTKKKASKTERWQAIAESAAKQSKCNKIPKVSEPISFRDALKKAESLDLLLVPYENELGMSATKNALNKIKSDMKIGVIIGPEGGFSPKEIEKASKSGGEIISLGKRILRTETAAITALSMLMLYSEINLG